MKGRSQILHDFPKGSFAILEDIKSISDENGQIQAKVGSVSSPDIGVVPKAGLAHQREVRLLPSLLVDVRLDGQPSVSARHAESGGWRSRLPRTRGVVPGALHAENCSHDVCEGIILPAKQERLKFNESIGRCRGRRAGCGGGQA